MKIHYRVTLSDNVISSYYIETDHFSSMLTIQSPATIISV